MRPFSRIALAICLIVFLVSAVDAAESRVLYAEGFSPERMTSNGAQKPSQQQRLRVRAFGQEFPLSLEENARIIASLAPAARGRVGDLKILRGTIEGRQGSWVRLTVRNGRYEGAFWDGSELYGVRARDTLPADQSLKAGTTAASVIYRASDIAHDRPMTCGVGGERLQANSLQRYKSLVRSLQAVSQVMAPSEIGVAIVADYEYYAYYGTGSLQTMITRMNMVDGIFATQVGVNIVPTEFTLFTDPNDPFDTSEAPQLLAEFGNYRANTPAIRDRGLAHLFTGRTLNGTTAGIGYVGALCQAQTGASLSEALDPVDSMLIIAHELGHNFGAPHDGEVGSACASVPQTFLMAPVLNGSSTFSSCSVQIMQTAAASAACVTPARTRDVAVSVPASSITTSVGQTFDFPVDVTSVGQSTAYNIIASVSVSGQLLPLSATMAGAACTVSGSDVNCQLPSMATGETQRLTVKVRAQGDGNFSAAASVLSTNDSNPANDRVTVPIQVNVSQAASIAFTPPVQGVILGSSLQIVADITGTGVDSLFDATARISAGTLAVTAVSTDVGNCTQGQGEWDCQLLTIAPQEKRKITITASATTIGPTSVNVALFAGSSPQRQINSGFATVNVGSQYDVAISAQGDSTHVVAIGDVTEWPITIASIGAQTVQGARMKLTGEPGVTLDFVAAGVTCTVGGIGLDCALGDLAPGTSINGRLRASGNATQRSYIDVDVPQTVPDDVRYNNHFLLTLDVRPALDVGVPQQSSPYALHDGVPMNASFNVFTFGAVAPNDVHATLTLPDSFTIQSATLAGGTCSVTGTTVACQLATMTQYYASINVAYTATTPGSYTGSLAVSAVGDSVPGNDSAQIRFDVQPNVDAHLIFPTGLRTLVTQPIDVPLNIVNNAYATPDARLDIDLSTNMTIESTQTTTGTCLQANFRITCQFGTLAPSSTTTVTVRIRFTSDTSSSIFPAFSSPSDVNSQNNGAQVYILVDPAADAKLTVANTAGTATVDTPYTIDTIDISSAGGRANGVFMDLYFDSSRVKQPVLSLATCDWTVTPAHCTLDDLPAGTVRRLQFVFTPSGTGALPIRMHLGARNETNPADNEQTVQLDVQAAPPPPPPPTGGGSGGGTTSSSGGGGGGGSLSISMLLSLLAVGLLKAGTRRRRA